jgi:hypothetical protein
VATPALLAVSARREKPRTLPWRETEGETVGARERERERESEWGRGEGGGEVTDNRAASSLCQSACASNRPNAHLQEGPRHLRVLQSRPRDPEPVQRPRDFLFAGRADVVKDAPLNRTSSNCSTCERLICLIERALNVAALLRGRLSNSVVGSSSDGLATLGRKAGHLSFKLRFDNN